MTKIRMLTGLSCYLLLIKGSRRLSAGNENHQQSSSNSTISLPTTILDNTSKFLDNMHSIRVAVALEPQLQPGTAIASLQDGKCKRKSRYVP